MKKEIVCYWNGMPSPERSGGDVYTARMLKEIISRGHTVDLMTAGGAIRLLDELHIKSRRLYLLDHYVARNVFNILALYTLRAINAFARVLFGVRRTRYDMVLSASPFMYDILPAIVSRADTKAVTIFHTLPDRHAHSVQAAIRFRFASFEQKLALHLIGRYFDTILVGNSDVQAKLHSRFPSKKIIVADAGIDIDAIESEKTDVNSELSDDILFVGRLTQQKGIYDLLEIAQSIKQTKRRVKIVGDGQDRKKLEHLIRVRELNNIDLLGFVSQSEKYYLMKNIGTFIFPSYEEGWGISPAEAMYCGGHCVMYELPHYRSIFRDYPVYVPLGDIPALADAVVNTHTLAPGERARQCIFMQRYDDQTVVGLVLDELGVL